MLNPYYKSITNHLKLVIFAMLNFHCDQPWFEVLKQTLKKDQVKTRAMIVY